MKKFLFVIILILLSATTYVSELVQERQAELQKLTRYTNSWSVSQLYLSYLRFEVFLAEYTRNPDDFSKDDILLQFDIVLSQLDLLTEGLVTQITYEAAKVQAVKNVKSRLSHLAEMINKGHEGVSQNERDTLKKFESTLAELASLSLAKDIEAINSSNKRIQALYAYYNYISVSLIILCVLLGGMMLLQNRRLNLSNRRSIKLTNELRASQRRLEINNDKLRFEAYHDSLTSLPNRHAFWEDLNVLQNTSALSHPVTAPGLMLFDLDLFKDINDTYGHDAGDYVLKEMSRRVAENIQEKEKIYRLGGDEFALLFFGLDEVCAKKRASFYRMLIKKPYAISGHALHVDASFGIAFPDHAVKPDILYKRADIALYEAKTNHSQTAIIFKDEMLERVSEERFIEKELVNAIQNGEIKVYYQPVVSISSGNIVCYEVLARWLHPVRGFISPDIFIPIAERTGLIHTLGEWILNEACREISLMKTEVNIAVNVSPLQFRSDGFVNMLNDVLSRNAIKPSQLELEITETSLMTDDGRTPDILNILTMLHEMGISISLDDFGTGYSSLSRLNSFPFDKVKIDRSFISALTEKQSSFNIVKSIMDVSKSLNMRVVAEGVETKIQLECMRTLGCDFVQGYLFGKPQRGIIPGK